MKGWIISFYGLFRVKPQIRLHSLEVNTHPTLQESCHQHDCNFFLCLTSCNLGHNSVLPLPVNNQTLLQQIVLSCRNKKLWFPLDFFLLLLRTQTEAFLCRWDINNKSFRLGILWCLIHLAYCNFPLQDSSPSFLPQTWRNTYFERPNFHHDPLSYSRVRSSVHQRSCSLAGCSARVLFKPFCPAQAGRALAFTVTNPWGTGRRGS